MLGRIINNTKIIEKAMDACWVRNEVIAQNIANADTPGYKRKTVLFESQLNEAIEKNRKSESNRRMSKTPASKSAVEDVEIKIIQDNSNLSYRLDGNNVDIDNEMASMAKNTIKYNVLTQSLNSSLGRIKTAINEGRR
ncbi:MAG TPA: flagellar basal body rod protein FlgB [Clostridiaceae bacterium]|nr:flagellar basal body rod protein FlgB [Clostridiaceae bacterium]